MKCPRCNSGYGYIRVKTKSFICRKCGKVSDLSIKQKAKNFVGMPDY